jgi:hypothetical protein
MNQPLQQTMMQLKHLQTQHQNGSHPRAFLDTLTDASNPKAPNQQRTTEHGTPLQPQDVHNPAPSTK